MSASNTTFIANKRIHFASSLRLRLNINRFDMSKSNKTNNDKKTFTFHSYALIRNNKLKANESSRLAKKTLTIVMKNCIVDWFVKFPP